MEAYSPAPPNVPDDTYNPINNHDPRATCGTRRLSMYSHATKAKLSCGIRPVALLARCPSPMAWTKEAEDEDQREGEDE